MRQIGRYNGYNSLLDQVLATRTLSSSIRISWILMTSCPKEVLDVLESWSFPLPRKHGAHAVQICLVQPLGQGWEPVPHARGVTLSANTVCVCLYTLYLTTYQDGWWNWYILQSYTQYSHQLGKLCGKLLLSDVRQGRLTKQIICSLSSLCSNNQTSNTHQFSFHNAPALWHTRGLHGYGYLPVTPDSETLSEL